MKKIFLLLGKTGARLNQSMGQKKNAKCFKPLQRNYFLGDILNFEKSNRFPFLNLQKKPLHHLFQDKDLNTYVCFLRLLPLFTQETEGGLRENIDCMYLKQDF